MRADRRTDRRADMMQLIVAFRNFANAPKYDVHYLDRYGESRYEYCVIIFLLLLQPTNAQTHTHTHRHTHVYIYIYKQYLFI